MNKEDYDQNALALLQDTQTYTILPQEPTKRNYTYHQRKGTPMGSPISVVVAEVVMQRLEAQLLSAAPSSLKLWTRYVDDGFGILDSKDVEPFFSHINRLLDFDNYHPDRHKRSVIRTLWKRADKVCFSVESMKAERKHLLQVLQNNGYPSRTIRKWTKARRTDTPEQRPHMTPRVTIPYIKGTSKVKDTEEHTQLASVAYRIGCTDCDTEYVGETQKKLATRVQTHYETPAQD
ncbi:uncharacterized protein LOC143026742 [Oratosquilla oratoria]|uniref:uncharacterized protein LOC143026742 n=1 Tax=Oratosquilla oratoria TaxID=337810 RepID=UPI003F7637DD